MARLAVMRVMQAWSSPQVEEATSSMAPMAGVPSVVEAVNTPLSVAEVPPEPAQPDAQRITRPFSVPARAPLETSATLSEPPPRMVVVWAKASPDRRRRQNSSSLIVILEMDFATCRALPNELHGLQIEDGVQLLVAIAECHAIGSGNRGRSVQGEAHRRLIVKVKEPIEPEWTHIRPGQ